MASRKKNNDQLATLAITMLLQLASLKLATSDPHPLQDYCVADTKSAQTVFLNGAPCIHPALVESADFKTSSLASPGDTQANPFGFNVTLTNAKNLPGSNTQGLTMARIDVAPRGVVPPHSHPRASEITTVLRGRLLVGFVDTSNRLFIKQLLPGESFVFPKAMIHFLYNLEPTSPAVAISGLNSQNPGAQLSALATFASNPAIPDEVLKISFQITEQEVLRIRKNLGG